MARRPPGVYKRKGSPFYQLYFTDAAGNEYRESSKTTNMKEAKEIREHRIKEVSAGLQRSEPASPMVNTTISDPTGNEAMNELSLQLRGSGIPYIAGPKPSLTFEQLKQSYLGGQSNKWTRKGITAAYKSVIAHFGNTDVFQVTPIEFRDYIKQREVQSGPAVARQELQFVRAAMREAESLKKLPWGAGEWFGGVEGPKQPDLRKRFFTDVELFRILQCSPRWFQPIVTFTTLTGFRREEACRLTWREVDVDHGRLHLLTSKNGHGRDVPMLPMVQRMMYRVRQKTRGRDPIFRNSSGGILTPGYLDEVFLDCHLRACVEDAMFHDTRRTFASWHAMAGTPLNVIADLMGHEDEDSSRIYIKLSPHYHTSHAKKVDPTAPPPEPPPNYFALFYNRCTDPNMSSFLDPILFGDGQENPGLMDQSSAA